MPAWGNRTQPATVRKPTRIRRAPVTGAVALALILAACTSSDPKASPVDESGSGPLPAVAELECELLNYPCSLAEVPEDIFMRSDALADEASGKLEAGDTTAGVETWLAGQDGMAEVDSDDTAIRFRLEGGRGTWVLGSAALGTRSAIGGALGVRSMPSRPASTRPPLDRPSPGLEHIVGEPIEQKRALVLSPFLFDFGETDDGAAVARILSGTRGYEGRVTHVANATPSASAVGVASFKGWRNLQVIHVVSHGARLCKEPPCRAVIAAGTLQGAVPEGPGIITKGVRLSFPDRGLELSKVEDPCARDLVLDGCGRMDVVLLTADFFRHEYTGGLTDALVFFNACEVFGTEATDLADAIRGTTSVFLGWSEKVDTTDAHDAAVALYEDLSERGYPTETSYSRLGDLQTDRAGSRLVLGKRAAGGDLRIRDIVTLLEPETGQPLSASSRVVIEGEQADGKPDAAPYRVRVDGIPPGFAPNVQLHVSVDGVETEPQPLGKGTSNDTDQWDVPGVAQLSFDLEEDTQVTFRAWVELPSGGENDDGSAATLIGRGGLVVNAKDTYTEHFLGGVEQVATSELVLRPVADPALPEGQIRYEVAGGSWTWTMGGGPDSTNCTYSSDTVSVDLARDQSSAKGSYLVVDSTRTPNTYWGTLSTIGPDATISKSGCDPDFYDGTYSHHTRVNWVVIDQDDRQPFPEGGSVTGHATSPSDAATREREWTIRPL